MLLTPLVDTPSQYLEGYYEHIHIKHLVRIRTIQGDGSSFLHACLNAFFVPYRSNSFLGVRISRKEMVGHIRQQLALLLSQPYDEQQSATVNIYDCLSKGKYKELSYRIKTYEINHMISELYNPTFFIDDKYLELISNAFNKDIYIINIITMDLHVRPEDPEIFYKKRDTIIVLALVNHFETVGLHLQNEQDTVTIFDKESSIASTLYKRYLHLHKEKYNKS